METSGLVEDIIDAHCHVASSDYTPLAFIEGVVDNSLATLSAQGLQVERQKLLDLYLARMNDPHCDQLVAEMAEANIKQAILLLPDLTYALRNSPLTIEEMFERHREILEKRPGTFFVFAGVDPRWGADGISLFERAVTRYGFHGLKLYPPCGYSASDRSLYPFYEICAQHRLPVVTHIGGTSSALGFGLTRPIFVDQPALDFPSVSFILAHGGNAYVEESVMLCAFRPNVYLDVSGFQTRPIASLDQLFSAGINHKIIFGSDWPVFRLQGNQKSFIENLLSDDSPLMKLRRREREGFFGVTIKRLLENKV
jgi:predicted TIM-barrel fold metal-dependent hydrolase